MANVNPELIERFQIEYQKNPKSRVFAALSEAYRKMDLLEEAQRLCESGVQFNPDFAGGFVAYAKVLLDLKEPKKALAQLERAVAISSENLLAHSLLGETLLELRRPKEALKAYKMVLFLNPNDEKAKRAVAKWEFLSADEYEDELFEMKPVFAMTEEPPVIEPAREEPKRIPPNTFAARGLERAVSLADAFTIRGEPERALAVLQDARNRVGTNPEIDRRLELLLKRTRGTEDADDPKPTGPPVGGSPYGVDPREKIRLKLETFLRRIEARRLQG